MSTAAESAPVRLSRLLSLVPWLIAHDGVSVREAATHFGITPEQLEKDLWLLVCCGLPGHGPEHLIDIQFWDDGGRIHVIDPQTLASPVRLSADESVSLVLGLRVLETLPGNHDRATIQELIELLTRIARDHVADSERWVLETDISDHVRDTVEQAMATGAAIAIEYHAANNDEVTDRVVMPTELSVVDGRVFLHAWCLGARANRTFRLDRIVSAALSEEISTGSASAPIPATDERISTSGSASDAPTTVVLALAPSARWLIDVYNLTVAEEDSEGNCTVEWGVWNSEWLIRQIIEWGGSVRLLEPSAWREALLAHVVELLDADVS
jgi:proteasome accessory factor C